MGRPLMTSDFVCASGSALTVVCRLASWLRRLRETPEFGDATCVAIACPACMTLGLAQSCAGYVTTVINGTDMVPTMSLGAPTAGGSAVRGEGSEQGIWQQQRMHDAHKLQRQGCLRGGARTAANQALAGTVYALDARAAVLPNIDVSGTLQRRWTRCGRRSRSRSGPWTSGPTCAPVW